MGTSRELAQAEELARLRAQGDAFAEGIASLRAEVNGLLAVRESQTVEIVKLKRKLDEYREASTGLELATTKAALARIAAADLDDPAAQADALACARRLVDIARAGMDWEAYRQAQLARVAEEIAETQGLRAERDAIAEALLHEREGKCTCRPEGIMKGCPAHSPADNPLCTAALERERRREALVAAALEFCANTLDEPLAWAGDKQMVDLLSAAKAYREVSERA